MPLPRSFELQPFTSSTASNTTSIERAQVRVIVIHEMPGITPLVAAFGRKIAERE